MPVFKNVNYGCVGAATDGSATEVRRRKVCISIYEVAVHYSSDLAHYSLCVFQVRCPLSRPRVLHGRQLPGTDPEAHEPDPATRVPGFESHLGCLVQARADHSQEVLREVRLQP